MILIKNSQSPHEGAHKLHSTSTNFVVLDFSSPIKENVVYMPWCQMNLLSIGSLANKGHYFLFGKNEVLGLDSHFIIIGRGHKNKINGLCKVPIRSIANLADIVNTSPNTNQIWNQQLGHTNQRNLQFLFQNKIVIGLSYLPACTRTCEVCNFGKQKQQRAPK